MHFLYFTSIDQRTTDNSGPKYLRSSDRDDIEEALTYALALVQSRYDHLREKQHKTTKWKERNPGLEKEVEIRL